MDTIEKFKAATKELIQYGPYEDNLFLQSMRVSAYMHDDPQPYLDAFEEITAPPQTQLDIHLVGQSIQGHEADASELGKFLTHLSSTAKNLTKDLAGTGRYRPQKITVQGLQPGSLRIMLKAPQANPTKEATEKMGEENPLFDEPQTLESRALWQIGAIFTESSFDDKIDAADPAMLGCMSSETRRHLRNAINVLKRNSWEIEGETLVRGAKKQKVRLTTRGANQLSETLKLEKSSTTSVKVKGTFTGHKAWEGREVYFKPDTGRRITLKSNDIQLLLQAAQLAADSDNHAEIVYQETQAINLDGQAIKGKIYRQLQKVNPYDADPASEQTSLEI